MPRSPRGEECWAKPGATGQTPSCWTEIPQPPRNSEGPENHILEVQKSQLTLSVHAFFFLHKTPVGNVPGHCGRHDTEQPHLCLCTDLLLATTDMFMLVQDAWQRLGGWGSKGWTPLLRRRTIKRCLVAGLSAGWSEQMCCEDPNGPRHQLGCTSPPLTSSTFGKNYMLDAWSHLKTFRKFIERITKELYDVDCSNAHVIYICAVLSVQATQPRPYVQGCSTRTLLHWAIFRAACCYCRPVHRKKQGNEGQWTWVLVSQRCKANLFHKQCSGTLTLCPTNVKPFLDGPYRKSKRSFVHVLLATQGAKNAVGKDLGTFRCGDVHIPLPKLANLLTE